MKDIEFVAELSINRTSGSDEETPMRITIEDSASGTRVLQASFSLEGFMRALTSQGGIEGKAILFSGPVGYKSETKHEILPRPKKFKDDKETQAILKPYEVDGWMGQNSDVHNHHRWVGDNQVQVLFRRYVNEAGEIWQQ